MLSDAETAQARTRLHAMTHTVHLDLFTEVVGCDPCAETREACTALALLASSLTLAEHDLTANRDLAATAGIDRAPAIVLSGDADSRIRFLGAPIAFELTSLVDAIELVASRRSGLSARSCDKLATLAAPVTIQVFSTPTCRFCGQVVALANRIALESPLVTSVAVSVIDFPDLIRQYRVTGVPKTVIGDSIELLGAQSEDELVDAVLQAAS